MMVNSKICKLTGILLILSALGFNGFFTWSIWLIVTGIFLLLAKPQSAG